MNSIAIIAQQCVELSEVIADAILRRTSPVSDELSEAEAKKAYGTRWLNRMRDEGLAKFRWKGNKKIFSRHQLDCLLYAEKEHARLVLKGMDVNSGKI